MPSFDPIRAMKALNDAGVKFVLIGGLASNAHGTADITADLDICYERSGDNLERLAEVLLGLRARLRGAPEGLPFLLDAKTLAAGDHFTFKTDVGDFDCLGTPAGTTGYDDLAANAIPFDFDGLQLQVASLEDLIRMKRAAGRDKDQRHIMSLQALQDILEGDSDPQ